MMNKSCSIYLDLCRFCAALMVFCHHYFDSPFTSGALHFPFGRQGVVIFFVISGYVIAFVSHEKENGLRDYAASRFARLYSVVLPALVLSFGLDMVGSHLDATLYNPEVHNWPFVRFLASLLFINQSWNLTISAFSNGPFWSLCYEFWYYVIFGVFTFVRSPWRYPLLTLVALIAGPRVLLLFPIWLIGVACYHMRRVAASFSMAPALFVLSLVWFVALVFGYLNPFDGISHTVKASLDDGYWSVAPGFRVFIGGDAVFASDYVMGFTFAMTILTCDSFARSFLSGPRLDAVIRYCASYTFSLYLYHVPLLFVVAAACSFFGIEGAVRHLLLLGALFFSTWVLGGITEHRKKSFYEAFHYVLGRVNP